MCIAQNVEPGAHQTFILVARARIMRESLPHFCGEHEIRVGCGTLNPYSRVMRSSRVVKTGVDFDGVKKFRQVADFVESPGLSARISVTRPVRVRPARWPHANVRRAPGSAGIVLRSHFAGKVFSMLFRFVVLPQTMRLQYAASTHLPD